MITTLRKMSLWTAVVGFCFFVAGDYAAAFGVRFLTECLRLPYFLEVKVRDQVALCVFIMGGCIFGLARIAMG